MSCIFCRFIIVLPYYLQKKKAIKQPMIRFYLTLRWYSQKWYSVIGFAFICKSFAFPKTFKTSDGNAMRWMEKLYFNISNAIERKITVYNFKEGFFLFKFKKVSISSINSRIPFLHLTSFSVITYSSECLQWTESFFLIQNVYRNWLPKINGEICTASKTSPGFQYNLKQWKLQNYSLWGHMLHMLHISKAACPFPARRNLWSLRYCPHLHVGRRPRSLTTHVCMTSSWSCWRSHLIEWRIPPHEALMKGFYLNDRDITAAQAPATNERGENIFCYKCCRWSYVVFFYSPDLNYKDFICWPSWIICSDLYFTGQISI